MNRISRQKIKKVKKERIELEPIEDERPFILVDFYLPKDAIKKNIIPINPEEILFRCDVPIKKTPIKSEIQLTEQQIFDLMVKIEPYPVQCENNIFDKCPDCLEQNTVIEENGCIICTSCGKTIKELIEDQAEWCQYGSEDTKGESMNRCGAVTNYYFQKSALGTVISGGSSRLKTWQNKWGYMVYKDKRFKDEMEYIAEICIKNDINKVVVDNAVYLWKKTTECKNNKGKSRNTPIIIRGENREGVMIACIYYACVLRNYPRSIKELSKIFKIKSNYITDGCTQFFNLMTANNISCNFKFSNPSDFIPRYGKKLKIPIKYIDLAKKISVNIKKICIAIEHTSLSIAAGSIVIIVEKYNLGLTKKQIAEAFSISEVTISKIYKKIVPFMDLVLHDDACTFIDNSLEYIE